MPALACLLDLPDELLTQIFSLIKSDTAQRKQLFFKLPLVCSRFNAVLRQPSEIWDTLRIQFADTARLHRHSNFTKSFHAWVIPRRAAFSTLSICGDNLSPLTLVFAYFGRRLTKLHLDIFCLEDREVGRLSDHLVAFGSLTHLTELSILGCNSSAELSLWNAGSLSALTHLQLESDEGHSNWLEHLPKLAPCLVSLCMVCEAHEEWTLLTELQHLQTLHLKGPSGLPKYFGHFILNEICDLRSLTALTLSNYEDLQIETEADCHFCRA